MKVHTDNQAEVFKRWLSDGKTWIGIFENKALDSQYCGERFALSFDISQDAPLGARAPDTPTFGPGWKYLLVAKCTTVETALEEMRKNL